MMSGLFDNKDSEITIYYFATDTKYYDSVFLSELRKQFICLICQDPSDQRDRAVK